MATHKLMRLCSDTSNRRNVAAEDVVKALSEAPQDERSYRCQAVLESAASAARKDVIKAIVNSFDCDIESMSRGLLCGALSKPNSTSLDMLHFIVGELGAKVDVGWDGDTPLLVAIVRGEFELLRVLVEDLKADVNFPAEHGDLPLHTAMEYDLK